MRPPNFDMAQESEDTPEFENKPDNTEMCVCNHILFDFEPR